MAYLSKSINFPMTYSKLLNAYLWDTMRMKQLQWCPLGGWKEWQARFGSAAVWTTFTADIKCLMQFWPISIFVMFVLCTEFTPGLSKLKYFTFFAKTTKTVSSRRVVWVCTDIYWNYCWSPLHCPLPVGTLPQNPQPRLFWCPTTVPLQSAFGRLGWFRTKSD